MSAAQPWDHHITLSEVCSLYDEGIRRFGGESSPPKMGCLEQSIGNAYTAELYTEANSSKGLVFAGYLLFYLMRDHCFVDGNKRIAWLCAMKVLANSQLTPNVSQNDVVEFCTRIADSTASDAIRDGSQVVVWLSEHVDAAENLMKG